MRPLGHAGAVMGAGASAGQGSGGAPGAPNAKGAFVVEVKDKHRVISAAYGLIDKYLKFLTLQRGTEEGPRPPPPRVGIGILIHNPAP